MKRDVRLAGLLVWVVIGAAVAGASWQIYSSYERTRLQIDTQNLNLAMALNTYAEGVVTESAMLLEGIVERMELDGMQAPQMRRIQQLAYRQERLLHQLSGLVILDANGRWMMSSSGSPSPEMNSSDRAFFIHHRDHPSHEIHIGEPIKSRSNGAWVITVSRRIDNSNRQFAGVVVVSLGIEKFLRMFGKMEVGTQGVISLVSSTGHLLVRYPYREEDLGRDFTTSPNYQRYFLNARSGTAAFRSTVDGIERFYAFRASDRFPIVTTVALGRDDALRAWRHQSLLTAAVVGALLLAVALVGRRLIFNIKKRIRAKEQLLATQEALVKSHEKLAVMAATDSLTGLANRRRFDEVLCLETKRAAREGHPISLLLIDLDYFKKFNDTYGHVAGDECLQAVAKILQLGIRRPGDLAARFGGEEFAVILPNTNLAGAQGVADVLVTGFRELEWPHCASPFGQVTASIGVATLTGAQADNSELVLIESADKGLYKAKERGRNCVAC